MNKTVSFLLLLLFATGAAAQQTQFFRVRVENTGTLYPYPDGGVFNTPVGALSPSPAFPGNSFVFEFDARKGDRLSFASMFAQSNDLFFGPGPMGIALWDASGQPRTADVTSEINLWDAGTELNQEPGAGPDQAPRQSGPDTGAADTDTDIRLVDDSFMYPADEDVIKVDLEHVSGTHFRVTISNVSDENTLMPTGGGTALIPLSPGVYVVHAPDASPLFTIGDMDRGEGLEGIAEDGDPAALWASISTEIGAPTVFSPGVWAVHKDAYPIYLEGTTDRGMGLERIAEEGNPMQLAMSLPSNASLTAGAFMTAVGAMEPAPLTPGNAFEFVIQGEPGDRFSMASMFGQSNDTFLGTAGEGVPLFDGSAAISGSIDDFLLFLDAGTEINEPLGIGPNQAPRQPAPDTGAPDPDNRVRPAVGTGLVVSDLVNVTIEPIDAVPLTLRIDNVSTATTLETSTGNFVPAAVSPGVLVVHTNGAPLFAAGMPDRGRGLERIAEEGNPAELAASLASQAGISSVVFNTPVGTPGPGPIGPGDSYEVSFEAAPGSHISLAMMFGQSNDAFYAPGQDGIALWDAGGSLRTGDLTSEFELWDAGTEMNQQPGAGSNQAPRQPAPDTGPADSDPLVRVIADGTGGFPPLSAVLHVTLMATSTASEAPPEELPSTAVLHQNYPNPFNPETTITFDLAESGSATLTVHDVLGREVATLFDGNATAGSHQAVWNGRDAAGRTVATGIYIYRLRTESRTVSRTMTFIK